MERSNIIRRQGTITTEEQKVKVAEGKSSKYIAVSHDSVVLLGLQQRTLVIINP